MNPPAPPPDRVVVAYLHPGDVSGDFMASLVNVLAYDVLHGSAHIFAGGGHFSMRSGANITSARNKVVANFLDNHNADWLWLLDSDMTFQPDTLAKLLDAADPVERPIVGGLCFGVWSEGHAEEIFPTLYIFNEQGEWFRLHDYPDDAVYQVGGTGAACLLVHRSVLVAMRERFAAQHPWRWFAEALHNQKPIGEDLMFCLRASACGFPVYVHTGVKVGHVKPRNVNEQAYQAYRAQLQPPKFVVVGTGRSGTGYISRALRLLGINCGHEEWWNPQNALAPNLEGDASWMAVPTLETYNGTVLHQVRHPLRVLSSLLNGDLREPWAQPYLDRKLEPLGGLSGDLTVDMMRYVATWHQLIDAAEPSFTWRLEDMDGKLLQRIAEAASGSVYPRQRCADIVKGLGAGVNKHTAGPTVTLDDLPDDWSKDVIAAVMDRYGYD